MKKTLFYILFFYSSLLIAQINPNPLIADPCPSSSIYFVSLEGSYSWNQFNGVKINGYPSTQHSDLFGGRLAGGIAHPVSDNILLSAELGGGYYGNTSPSIVEAGVKGHFSIDGYDLLLGSAYKMDHITYFGKVGVMGQNLRSKITKDLAIEIPGDFISGITSTDMSQTQLLPEVKLGALYQLNNKIDLSLAYMHVFGSVMEKNMMMAASQLQITTNGHVNSQNPSLNSVMIGIQYNLF